MCVKCVSSYVYVITGLGAVCMKIVLRGKKGCILMFALGSVFREVCHNMFSFSTVRTQSAENVYPPLTRSGQK